MINIVLYILLPIVGTVMLLMVMDKRMKAVAILGMFWRAFKGEPPISEEDRIALREPTAQEILDGFVPYRFRKSVEYEKVNWKKEGF